MAENDLNEGEGEAIESRQFSPIHFSLPESNLEDMRNDAGPLNSKVQSGHSHGAS